MFTLKDFKERILRRLWEDMYDLESHYVMVFHDTIDERLKLTGNCDNEFMLEMLEEAISKLKEPDKQNITLKLIKSNDPKKLH